MIKFFDKFKKTLFLAHFWFIFQFWGQKDFQKVSIEGQKDGSIKRWIDPISQKPSSYCRGSKRVQTSGLTKSS